uniref:Uncharacterized protein n=1 Tax=Oryza barthii TaxID=65489 RepID=A0A0D3EQ47_9ORYZ
MKLTPEAAFRATMGTIQDSDIIIVVFHNMKPEDCLLSSILCFVQASQALLSKSKNTLFQKCTCRVKAVTSTAMNREPVSSSLKSRSIWTPMIQATSTLSGTCNPIMIWQSVQPDESRTTTGSVLGETTLILVLEREDDGAGVLGGVADDGEEDDADEADGEAP